MGYVRKSISTPPLGNRDPSQALPLALTSKPNKLYRPSGTTCIPLAWAVNASKLPAQSERLVLSAWSIARKLGKDEFTISSEYWGRCARVMTNKISQSISAIRDSKHPLLSVTVDRSEYKGAGCYKVKVIGLPEGFEQILKRKASRVTVPSTAYIGVFPLSKYFDLHKATRSRAAHKAYLYSYIKSYLPAAFAKCKRVVSPDPVAQWFTGRDLTRGKLDLENTNLRLIEKGRAPLDFNKDAERAVSNNSGRNTKGNVEYREAYRQIYARG